MIKTLDLSEAEYDPAKSLLYVCKKQMSGSQTKLSIDFLLLEKEMEELNHIQSKTCQEIVEFVDEHREQFIAINERFSKIESSVSDSESILRNIIPKIDQYKAKYYSTESKMQDFITNYEKQLISKQLAAVVKEESEFLINFVEKFEAFININVEQLSLKHKFYISRFLKKHTYFKNLFEHPMVKIMVPNHLSLINLLDNMVEEVQFYLSEQLSRVVLNKETRQRCDDNFTTIEELQIWYQYLGKKDSFFEAVQQTIVGRELPVLESSLLANKQNLLIGKDEELINRFFISLFKIVENFPEGYSQNRIIKIVQRFLSKKELNFLYSYVVPTFPISYSAYKSAVAQIKNTTIRNELSVRHGWNLKFWADLRIKSIMDRSSKDRENNLNKWIEIIFKKSFMLYGVKNYMIRLAFQVVNRYCSKLEEDTEFSNQTLNDCLLQLRLVPITAKEKLFEAYEVQIKENEVESEIIRQRIIRIVKNIEDTLRTHISKWMLANTTMVTNSCKSSLQTYRTFVTKIINKKDRSKVAINQRQNILKPLHGFIKNNPDLSEESIGFLQSAIVHEVVQYYDTEYVKQICGYCKNVTPEQMKTVMEVVAIERESLFGAGQSNA